jgi:type VI secretion system protein ImpA
MNAIPPPDVADVADEMAARMLRPVSEAQPCGPSLEYDPDYASLTARLLPRAGAQYGTFVDEPGTPAWASVARDCEALLQRTRDLTLLVAWCRASLALAQAPGLARALELLHAVATRWPDHVHPQRCVDGLEEPALRANAIAALADPEGLLGEVGRLVLPGVGAMRPTVRDVARALATPRPSGSADPASVRRYLAELRESDRGAGADADAMSALRVLQGLQRASACVIAIDEWSRRHLGEEAPSLERLLRLLEPFATMSTHELSDGHSSAAGGGPATTSLPSSPAAWPIRPYPMPSETPCGSSPRARHDAAACIRDARAWFETHEPSSPVAVLLKQAERMVGQRFVQVADAIPLELLRQWDAHPEAGIP